MTALFTIAALIVLAVIYTLYSNAKIEARWPRQGRLVMAGGVRAHVIEHGEGPDVLLLHGAASNGRELLAAFDGRLAGLRLIAPDRPGLGYSKVPPNSQELGVQAAFIADILTQSARGPVVAVGHSWGSGVVLRLAIDRPDLVKALVLIAPASHPWKPTFNLPNRLAIMPVVGDLLVWTLPALLGPLMLASGIKKGFAPGPVKPEDYADIIGTPLFFRPISFKANARDMEAGSVQMGLQAPAYKNLNLPVSIISGQCDVIVFNSIHAAGLARDIPHASSYRVMHGGHMPHWVDPDLVARVILAHANDLPMPEHHEQFRA
jgi:pimeloyl-ACP methyl ester carboxylesterase